MGTNAVPLTPAGARRRSTRRKLDYSLCFMAVLLFTFTILADRLSLNGLFNGTAAQMRNKHTQKNCECVSNLTQQANAVIKLQSGQAPVRLPGVCSKIYDF